MKATWNWLEFALVPETRCLTCCTADCATPDACCEGTEAPAAYVVVNENTLGYVYSSRPDSLNILHGSILRGAVSTAQDGSRYLSPLDVVRPATIADFRAYSVEPPPDFVAE